MKNTATPMNAAMSWLASWRRGAHLLMVLLSTWLVALPLNASAADSPNGLIVTLPNGYANLERDDLWLQSTAGEVRWMRRWDGQEWKFNPHWESLSQSWRNMTGSQTADSTGGTSSDGGASGVKISAPSSSSGGGASEGCWVWVDEDWQPSVGTTMVGGIPDAGPMLPARTTPFNRLMGEDAADYAPLERVSVDYAGLCMGSSFSSGSVRDAEGIRRINELYLGDEGRYAFNNRSILEKRAVQQPVPASAEALYTQLGQGRIALNLQSNSKGFRWADRSGDWIDYNTQGQVVAWGDRNSNTVWLVRDTGGTVRGVVDANGRVLFTLHYRGALITEIRDYPIAGVAQELPSRSIKYEYDDRSRLVAVTDARGFVTRYDYDVSNRLIKITDAQGGEELIRYNGETVSQRVNPDGAVTDYAFDFDDVNKQFLSKVTGPETAAGRRVDDQTHSRVGKLVRQIVNGRTETEVRYDTGARVEHATNARGFTTRTTTNEFEQIVSIAYPDGGEVKRQYSPLHLRMTEAVDAGGFRTQFEYDGKGNLLRKTRAVGTSVQDITDYERNALGQVVRTTRKGRTEANGTVTPDAELRYDYDAQGQLLRATDAEGYVRQYVHDRTGNLVRYVDPLGRTSFYTVDAEGYLVKSEDALGHVDTYEYDRVGNRTGHISPRGKKTLIAHDAMDRVVSVQRPNGGRYRMQYNGQGMPVSETDEDGRESRVEYDNFQRLTRQIDGKGNVTEYDYQVADGTAGGRLGALQMPTQTKFPTFTQQQRFDERERQTSQTLLNPTPTGVEGLMSSTKYDKRGQVVESTNADGKTSFYAYDALGRTTRFTNSLGKSIDLTWDTRGNLIEVKDYNGRSTRFEYDRADRLLKETQPLGQSKRYTYDAIGNRTSVTDAAGQRIQFVYDALDRPARTEVFAANATSASLVYTFTHDESGNLTGWSDGQRSAVMVYDDEDREVSQTLSYGNGVTLDTTYSYTAAGYRKTQKLPDGTEIGYTHEAHGELSAIELPGEGTISVNSWNWVAPKRLTLPGGTVRDMTRDGLLKLTGLTVRNPGQETVFELSNRYGRMEEIQQKIITDRSGSDSSTVAISYGYDSERRLTRVARDAGGVGGETVHSIGLDAAGNRTSYSPVSGNWVYDENNRLTQRGDTRYDYDANGNLIRKTVGSGSTPASVTRFGYDVMNRLVEVRDGANALIASYVYDPFDNRIIKDLYRGEDGQPLASAQRTHFLYGHEGLIAEADAAGQVTSQYGWRPDGGWSTDPLFIKTAIRQGESSSVGYAYFHNDHLGAPMRATNKAGQVVWRADYDSNGLATVALGHALRNNLRLPGQYYDAETGLHYNTRRYYDPQSARYITADPVGFDGGWNLYEYAGSDPSNQVDPSGEWVWVVVQVAITAYDIYTTYQEYKETGCFDWTTLIPVPKVIPRIKWLKKLFKKCSTPCECMGGGKNSFSAETLVHAQDAWGQPSLRAISSLSPGDKVLAFSEWKTGADAYSYEPITDVMVTPRQKRTMVHLTLDDGQTIDATDGHPFLTAEGWRDAVLLAAGTELHLASDGSHGAARRATVVDVRLSEALITTYNLEVAHAHTFFVGEEGLLVHNGKTVPPPDIDELPGFPGTKRDRNYKWPTWTSKKRICQWDTLHGDVEVFTSGSEEHLGGFNHQTGERLPGKPGRAVPGRRTRR